MHFIDPEQVGSGLVLAALMVFFKAIHKFWTDLNMAFVKIRKIYKHLNLDDEGNPK